MTILIRIESDIPSPSYDTRSYSATPGRRSESVSARSRRTTTNGGGGQPRKAVATMTDSHSVLFDAADGIPFDDYNLWTDHRLPLAGPRAYPFAAHSPGARRSAARAGKNWPF